MELCCGKGAVIINIAKNFSIKGIGIDLYPAFIDAAIKHAETAGVKKVVEFKVMDIKKAVKLFKDYDLVIAGYDTDALEDEIETLNKIKQCVSDNGFILYETANSSINEIVKIFDKTSLKILSRTIYTKDEKIKINFSNTEKLKKRAKELIRIYPDDIDILNNYIYEQEEESKELEDNLCWAAFLLQNN